MSITAGRIIALVVCGWAIMAASIALGAGGPWWLCLAVMALAGFYGGRVGRLLLRRPQIEPIDEDGDVFDEWRWQ